MARISVSELVPVRYAYPERESRQDGWGRLTHVAAQGAQLLTRFKLSAGERILLSFRLGGEDLEEIPAEVAAAALDADGYFLAELRFPSELSRVRIGRVIRDIL